MSNETTVKKILTELSNDRPVFHSECDFQHELAVRLRDSLNPKAVRLEKSLPFLDGELSSKYELDIFLLTKKNERIGIELKYKTKSIGRYELKGESFFLKNHGAQPSSKYLFLKDIFRLEKLKARSLIDEGFGILLTNDHVIWENCKVPRQERINIHESRILRKDSPISFTLDPNKPFPKNFDKHFPEFQLSVTYHPLKWTHYSDANDSEFRYLLINV